MFRRASKSARRSQGAWRAAQYQQSAGTTFTLSLVNVSAASRKQWDSRTIRNLAVYTMLEPRRSALGVCDAISWWLLAVVREFNAGSRHRLKVTNTATQFGRLLQIRWCWPHTLQQGKTSQLCWTAGSARPGLTFAHLPCLAMSTVSCPP